MEKIRKINIVGLLELLEHLYDNGVDYVDISGKQAEDFENDILSVSFAREYMAEDAKEYFDEFSVEELSDTEDPNSKIEVKLSDEDLNQLI